MWFVRSVAASWLQTCDDRRAQHGSRWQCLGKPQGASDSPSTRRERLLMEAVSAVWVNWSGGYSHLCRCRSISSPWSRVKLKHAKSQNEGTSLAHGVSRRPYARVARVWIWPEELYWIFSLHSRPSNIGKKTLKKRKRKKKKSWSEADHKNNVSTADTVCSFQAGCLFDAFPCFPAAPFPVAFPRGLHRNVFVYTEKPSL